MYWLLKLCSRLPLRFLQVMGAALGGMTFKLSSELRERAKENLEQAGYSDPHLFERVGRNAGRQALESLWVWYRPADTVLSKITISEDTYAMVKEAMASKRPIVFMTPHVGCFEVLPVWLAATFYKETGRKISVLYRPPKVGILRKLVGEARQAPGIEACPTTIVGVKRVIRNLKQGHTFGALPDQAPSKGEGVWADFFGRPAYTMTLPVRVAKQFDAIRIFAWGVRSGHGWHLEAERWDEPLTGVLHEDAAAMNAKIEEIIRRMPEQYAWSYNRYKVPAGAHPFKKETNK
ncbi:MAG: lysophospholipid acyltransferase family protein [Sutterella wadsworthensis]|nr:lysophospholipid acyltransferase family protein [Sutterella wadsworthensis]